MDLPYYPEDHPNVYQRPILPTPQCGCFRVLVVFACGCYSWWIHEGCTAPFHVEPDFTPFYIFKPETGNIHEQCRYHETFFNQPKSRLAYAAAIFVDGEKLPNRWKCGTLDGEKVAVGWVNGEDGNDGYYWGIGHEREAELTEVF